MVCVVARENAVFIIYFSSIAIIKRIIMALACEMDMICSARPATIITYTMVKRPRPQQTATRHTPTEYDFEREREC